MSFIQCMLSLKLSGFVYSILLEYKYSWIGCSVYQFKKARCSYFLILISHLRPSEQIKGYLEYIHSCAIYPVSCWYHIEDVKWWKDKLTCARTMEPCWMVLGAGGTFPTPKHTLQPFPQSRTITKIGSNCNVWIEIKDVKYTEKVLYCNH